MRFVLAGLVVAVMLLIGEGAIPLPQGRREWAMSITWSRKMIKAQRALAFTLALGAFASQAWAAELAGMVKNSKGQVSIERAGQRMPATVGAAVEVGDKLRTGNHSVLPAPRLPAPFNSSGLPPGVFQIAGAVRLKPACRRAGRRQPGSRPVESSTVGAAQTLAAVDRSREAKMPVIRLIFMLNLRK